MPLAVWLAVVSHVASATAPLRIGIVGKYVSLADAYLSVVEALNHASAGAGVKPTIDWIQAEDAEGLLAEGRLHDLDGIVIPGGFGPRGVEGKIAAANWAREHGVPCLGLCLGMQVMTIEYARNALGLERANSSEFDRSTPHPVIDIMETQRGVTDKGGTMRLGAYIARLKPGSQVAEAYGAEVVSDRHRHRLEFNPRYRGRFDAPALSCSGTSPDGRLVEFIELEDHPFWVATQGHPEFKSRPTRPAPLFAAFVAAAAARTAATRVEVPQGLVGQPRLLSQPLLPVLLALRQLQLDQLAQVRVEAPGVLLGRLGDHRALGDERRQLQ